MDTIRDLIAAFLALYGFISLMEDINDIVEKRRRRRES